LHEVRRLKFRIGLAEIVAGELRVWLHFPGQETLAERPVGEYDQILFVHERQHIAIQR